MATPIEFVTRNVEREAVGNKDGCHHFERRPRIGEVADCAVDGIPAELYRGGFQHAAARRDAVFVVHGLNMPGRPFAKLKTELPKLVVEFGRPARPPCQVLQSEQFIGVRWTAGWDLRELAYSVLLYVGTKERADGEECRPEARMVGHSHSEHAA
jgi:hypothetical protein